MNHKIVETDSIDKSFGDVQALESVGINVNKGSIYGLVGPNGAGKTTLLQVLMGIYRPDKGKVSVMNECIEDNTGLKQKVIFIPDQLHYSAFGTVKQMKGLYRDMYIDFDEDRFSKICETLNIDERKRIGQLSKGMKKQVAFLMAVSAKPEIMLLDEPVDGLDPVVRRQIWSMILQDVAERQMTVVISSHNLRELDDLCDHIGVLHEGHLVIEQDLEELKSEIHKVQVLMGDADYTELNPLNIEQTGKMTTLILKGRRSDIEQRLMSLEVEVLDFMGLTLEEIFIYELGGAGYEFKNLIL